MKRMTTAAQVKITALFLAILALSACAKADTNPTATPTAAPTETAQPTAKPTNAPDAYKFSPDNFPVMDGSTSQVPLGRAIVSALLGYDDVQAEEVVSFNRTSQSFRNLMWGECDILVAAEPAESIWAEYEQNDFEYEMTHIATDALVFVVNSDNPVSSLTTEQIQDIYTGRITNWSEVGGDDVEIVPFQRNSEAGSQAAIERLVMDGLEMMSPPKDYVVDSMSGLMEAVKGFDGSAGAIGYSVYYYANDMRMAEGLKIIAVDGIDPEPETIRDGLYPHRALSYTVIAADEPEDSPARIMYQWLQSSAGQALIDSMGYVSTGADSDIPHVYLHREVAPLPFESIGTRLSDAPLTELYPSDAYGELIPYLGERLYSDGYPAGELLGLATGDGMVITDPIYNTIYRARQYNHANGEFEDLGIMVLIKTIPDADTAIQRYALAASDGSWITDFEYEDVIVGSLGVVGVRSYENFDCVCIDSEGAAVFDTTEWALENIPPYSLYTLADFSEGYALLDVNGVQMFVDIHGETYSAEGMTDAKGFSNGISAAFNGEFWGYIDTDFQWIIPPAYSNAESFYLERAVVTNSDETTSIIDSEGTEIANLGEKDVYFDSSARIPFFYCHSYSDGISYAGLNGEPLNYDEVYTGGIDGAVALYAKLGDLYALEMEDGSFIICDSENNEVLRSDNYLYPISDSVTDGIYIFEEAGALFGTYYDLQGRLLITGATYGNPVNGHFPCTGSIYSGHKNINNEWVLKLPINDSGD